MAFRIRTIDLTASGREIVREREVADDELVIGARRRTRSTCPTSRSSRQHVRVLTEGGGRLRLLAAGRSASRSTGARRTMQRIDPGEGAELALGPYRIDFARGADGRSRSPSASRATRQDKAEALAGFSLGSVLPGKRAMAWAGLAAILLAFLACRSGRT
jgi:hypothetical protein